MGTRDQVKLARAAQGSGFIWRAYLWPVMLVLSQATSADAQTDAGKPVDLLLPAAIQPSLGQALQVKNLERIRLIESRRTDEVRRHVRQALSMVSAHKWAAAAQLYAVAYALQPGPQLLAQIAQVCREGQLDMAALLAYQRLQQEDPADADLPMLRAEIEQLRARVETDPEIETTQAMRGLLEEGKQQYQRGLYVQAARTYALVYALRRLPRTLFNAAQTYRRGEQYDLALILYGRFLQEEPGSPLAREALGYVPELNKLAFLPPAYRRKWFWPVVLLSAAAVAGGAAGLGIALQHHDPATTNGTFVVSLPM